MALIKSVKNLEIGMFLQKTLYINSSTTNQVMAMQQLLVILGVMLLIGLGFMLMIGE